MIDTDNIKHMVFIEANKRMNEIKDLISDDFNKEAVKRFLTIYYNCETERLAYSHNELSDAHMVLISDRDDCFGQFCDMYDYIHQKIVNWLVNQLIDDIERLGDELRK